MGYRILAINPGSTSTKVAVFRDGSKEFELTVRHPAETIKQFAHVIDQFDWRYGELLNELKQHNIDLHSLDAVVGRGGLLRPIEGGTYSVNDSMIADLKAAKYGEHASNLGGLLAKAVAELAGGKPAFIVDPVVVDEMEPLARYSGIPEIERRCIWHALNQKAIARRAARELGKSYGDVNLIVAHLGGGISVGAHKSGRVVDVNNALDGDGPIAPERAGTIPASDLVKLCFSGKYTLDQMKRKLTGGGGLVAHLGTNDGRDVQSRIAAGDGKARLVYEAVAYTVAKEIGACAAVLRGSVDAVVLTGGLAHDSRYLVPWISERVSFIAPVLVFAGEDELEALALGAERVLTGEENSKTYE
jgi:butyrate kinase